MATKLHSLHLKCPSGFWANRHPFTIGQRIQYIPGLPRRHKSIEDGTLLDRSNSSLLVTNLRRRQSRSRADPPIAPPAPARRFVCARQYTKNSLYFNDKHAKDASDYDSVGSKAVVIKPERERGGMNCASR